MAASRAHCPSQVCDAVKDSRFSRNPLVLRGPCIRYYAGAPLIAGTPEQPAMLGTLCIIDREPRAPLDEAGRATLKTLAAMVVDQLRSRLQSKHFREVNTQLVHSNALVVGLNNELTSLIDGANAPIFSVDDQLHVTVWNRAPRIRPHSTTQW